MTYQPELKLLKGDYPVITLSECYSPNERDLRGLSNFLAALNRKVLMDSLKNSDLIC